MSLLDETMKKTASQILRDAAGHMQKVGKLEGSFFDFLARVAYGRDKSPCCAIGPMMVAPTSDERAIYPNGLNMFNSENFASFERARDALREQIKDKGDGSITLWSDTCSQEEVVTMLQDVSLMEEMREKLFEVLTTEVK